MGKKITGLVLAASLLWLAACAQRSEAKIQVFNKGTLQTVVDLDYAQATINPGQTETFTVNWPGGGNCFTHYRDQLSGWEARACQ